MSKAIDFTTDRIANDLARLRQALAELDATTAADTYEHAYAVGRLIGSAQILLGDVDAQRDAGDQR